ncbi:MAG: adenylate/guanylate cyclase domain-containing protein [Sandaracinaceae bacterium]
MAGLRDLIGKTPGATRVQLPYGAASTVGLGVHIVLLLTFAALGVWPMAAFNVLSVMCFVVVRVLFKRGQLGVALGLAIGEVILHQVLAVSFCGWDPGYQYYLLTVAPLTLMLPGVGPRLGALLACIPMCTFIALGVQHELGHASPSYPLPEPWSHYLGLFNLLFSFAILWVFIAFYRRGSEMAEDRLSVVVERSERLLFGILPPPIVERLREQPGVVADAFDEVTVLFTDLVGFTGVAQDMDPTDLVRMLDEVFATFDDLVAARGLEKIKTIGDAYMVASGIPESRADHAEAMAHLALEIQDALAAYAERTGHPLQIRLGMHTGPVVAGVIGKTKFAYDLWGDAVNTASRMESHGEPGRVHITAATAEKLRDTFVVEERGEVEVKGKGAMQTYWLVGPKAD